jgi:hypothetical protein
MVITLKALNYLNISLKQISDRILWQKRDAVSGGETKMRNPVVDMVEALPRLFGQPFNCLRLLTETDK